MPRIEDYLKCDCRCHYTTGMKHFAACCCMHRYKIQSDCPECNPEKSATTIFMPVPEGRDE